MVFSNSSALKSRGVLSMIGGGHCLSGEGFIWILSPAGDTGSFEKEGV